MAFSLTCACGARLEVDDVFAGQIVQCPDCSLGLKVPQAHNPLLRTSGLALASLLLALVGAFTVVGTLLAVVVGVAALVHMHGKGDRLAGRGYAVAGIMLGLLLTAVTGVAFTSSELFGLRRVLAEARWVGKLDFSGSDEILRVNEGYAISRPSREWGVYQETAPNPNDRNWDDLLLVLPGQDAAILCIAKLNPQDSLDRCCELAVNEFKEFDKAGLFGRKAQKRKPARFQEDRSKRQQLDGPVETMETVLEKSLAGQDRTFLMHVIKKRDGVCYVVLAGTRTKNFEALEPQFREALKSFRVLEVGEQR